MPLKATSARRRIIVGVLFGLAIVGGVIRYFAPDPSLTRDMGNLLLVLWVPAIGNVIAFVVNKLRKPKPAPPGFAPGQPFAPQLVVELVPFSAQVRPALGRLDPREAQCTLVVGTEGFTARMAEPLAGWLVQSQPQTVELEMLRPALALPALSTGTAFRVLAGTSVVGSGRVLQVLGQGSVALDDPTMRPRLTDLRGRRRTMEP